MARLAAAMVLAFTMSLVVQESVVGGGQPLCTGTYVTDSDNVGAGGNGPPDGDIDVEVLYIDPNHPIEVYISVTQPADAILTVRAYDAGDPGEVNQVTINGNYRGNLSGGSQVWSYTSLGVAAADLILGNNLVQIISNDGLLVDCAAISSSVGGMTGLTSPDSEVLLQSQSSGGVGRGVGVAAVMAAGALTLAGPGLFGLRRNTRREA